MSRRLLAIAAALCVGFTAIAAAMLWPDREGDPTSVDAEAAAPGALAEGGDGVVGSAPASEPKPPAPFQPEPRDEVGSRPFAIERATAPLPVRVKLKKPPAAGVLFDVDTGEVLWARRPAQPRPIASLTKMMTALIIAENHSPDERVLIGRKPPRVEGSRIGVLKTGRKVPLRGLFAGLLMASGNDAAAALAEHDAGTIAHFVAKMNRRSAELGLSCTSFAGPAGLQDRANGSCAYDLAALARAALTNPWIASLTSRRSAKLRFPIRGGRLHLANNHYFVQRGVRGVPAARVTGVKTGYTSGAGRCYVTTARLGGRHLGVVLLDSPNPLKQVPRLLRAGFRSAP